MTGGILVVVVGDSARLTSDDYYQRYYGHSCWLRGDIRTEDNWSSYSHRSLRYPNNADHLTRFVIYTRGYKFRSNPKVAAILESYLLLRMRTVGHTAEGEGHWRYNLLMPV